MQNFVASHSPHLIPFIILTAEKWCPSASIPCHAQPFFSFLFQAGLSFFRKFKPLLSTYYLTPLVYLLQGHICLGLIHLRFSYSSSIHPLHVVGYSSCSLIFLLWPYFNPTTHYLIPWGFFKLFILSAPQSLLSNVLEQHHDIRKKGKTSAFPQVTQTYDPSYLLTSHVAHLSIHRGEFLHFLKFLSVQSSI